MTDLFDRWGMSKNRIVANIVVLMVAAAAVFFIGWLQFTVRPGNCAIMVTKTGGVYEKPIVPGKFEWRWERLLPTNVDLRTFALTPYTSKQSVSGSLPSADIYSKQMKNNPDFSYAAVLSITMEATPEQILNLVKSRNIKSQKELNDYFDSRAVLAAKKVMEYFLDKKESDISFSTKAVSNDELAEIITNDKNDFLDMSITDVSVISAKVPDLYLYKLAKNSYNSYQLQVTESLRKIAGEQAVSIVEENRSLERLEKLGQLLQKYPQLQEVFKNGDATSIMNAVKLFH
jgi:hypothetical protein